MRFRPISAILTFLVAAAPLFAQVSDSEMQKVYLIEPSETYVDVYAHKSYVIKHEGVVYHFYCAVNKKDQRGIAVATSTDKGTSPLRFKD